MQSFIFKNGKFIDRLNVKADNVKFIKDKYLKYVGMPSFDGMIAMTMDGVVMADHEMARQMYNMARGLEVIDDKCNLKRDARGNFYNVNLLTDEETFGTDIMIDDEKDIVKNVTGDERLPEVVITPPSGISFLGSVVVGDGEIKEEFLVDKVGEACSLPIVEEIPELNLEFNSAIAMEATVSVANPGNGLSVFSSTNQNVIDVDPGFKASFNIDGKVNLPGRVFDDPGINVGEYVSWYSFNEVVLLTNMATIDSGSFKGCRLVAHPKSMKKFGFGYYFYSDVKGVEFLGLVRDFFVGAKDGAVLFVRRMMRFYAIQKTSCEDFDALDDLKGMNLVRHGGFRVIVHGGNIAQSLYNDFFIKKFGVRKKCPAVSVTQFFGDKMTVCDFRFDIHGDIIPLIPKSVEDVFYLRPKYEVESYEAHLYFFLVIFFSDMLIKLVGRAGITINKLRTMYGCRGFWISTGRLAMFMGFLLANDCVSIRGHDYVFSFDNIANWGAMLSGAFSTVARVLRENKVPIIAKPFYGYGVETGISPVLSSLALACFERPVVAAKDYDDLLATSDWRKSGNWD